MSITFCKATMDDDGAIFHHGGERVDHPADCDGQNGDCEFYGCYDFIEEGVNMSNANAWAIQVALGMEPEYVGGMDADDLRGRCLVALAMDQGELLDLPNDPGTQALLEAFGAGHEGGPTVIAGTRPEGYVQAKVSLLLELAEANAGGLIGWS